MSMQGMFDPLPAEMETVAATPRLPVEADPREACERLYAPVFRET